MTTNDDGRLIPEHPAGWCVACAHHLHGACMGWWGWCACACGLLTDEGAGDG